jgi:hypothetical protein
MLAFNPTLFKFKLPGRARYNPWHPTKDSPSFPSFVWVYVRGAKGSLAVIHPHTLG